MDEEIILKHLDDLNLSKLNYYLLFKVLNNFGREDFNRFVRALEILNSDLLDEDYVINVKSYEEQLKKEIGLKRLDVIEMKLNEFKFYEILKRIKDRMPVEYTIEDLGGEDNAE